VGSFIGDVQETDRNQAMRDTELRGIALRALAEASAKGFSAADLRRELNALSKGAS
jgi:hypothetical protein